MEEVGLLVFHFVDPTRTVLITLDHSPVHARRDMKPLLTTQDVLTLMSVRYRLQLTTVVPMLTAATMVVHSPAPATLGIRTTKLTKDAQMLTSAN